MGLFSNIARWFNNSPNQDAFEDAKEEWKAENGNKGIGPYTQARHDWRSRIGQCPGSGKSADSIQFVDRYRRSGKGANVDTHRMRVGICPVCKKSKLAVTKKGMTWPHKTPAKSTPA